MLTANAELAQLCRPFFQRGMPACTPNFRFSGLLEALLGVLEPLLSRFSVAEGFEGLKNDRCDYSRPPRNQKKFRLLPLSTPKAWQKGLFWQGLWISQWISTGWVVGKPKVMQGPSFYTELLLKRYSDYAGFIFALNL
jgi:hypothetical protein